MKYLVMLILLTSCTDTNCLKRKYNSLTLNSTKQEISCAICEDYALTEHCNLCMGR